MSLKPIVEEIENYEDKTPSSTDRPFPDFIIESEDGQEIPCHRVFLATWSKVFRAMFESDMKEASENRLKLEFQAEVLQQFVDFFYDTEVRSDILLKNYEDFLNLSEKYDLDLLKLKTELVLMKNLSLENTVDYYMLGDLYNAKHLKDAAKKFMINNKNCLKDTKLATMLKSYDSDKVVDIMQILL